MPITTMLSIGIQVPVPQKISGFNQILLPFQSDVWMTLGNTYRNIMLFIGSQTLT